MTFGVDILLREAQAMMQVDVRHATLFVTVLAHVNALASPVAAQAVGGASRAWELSATASVVIGTEESGYTFDNVASAVRLSDGRFVVADGGMSSRLTVLSSRGRLLRQPGGVGDGPGEFRWITSLHVGPNDSLYVYDQALQRLTVLSAEGDIARAAAFRLTPGVRGGGGQSTVARLSDGTWVGIGAEAMLQGPPGRIVRDTVSVGLLDGDLSSLRHLTDVPGRMTTTTLLDGRPVGRVPAFSPEVLWATWGNCVFVASGEGPVVTVYTSRGELVNTISGPGVPRPVSRAHLQARLDYDLRRYGREREASIRTLNSSEAHPAYLPYYSRMVVDQRGSIWLQEYAPPWGEGRRWYVVSQTGRTLGEVLTQRPMRILSITDEGVLARTSGEYGEHMVEWILLASRPATSAEAIPQCSPAAPRRNDNRLWVR